MTKILKAFPKHPHLRMAVAALALAGEDKLLACGHVEEFEAWVYSHPSMHNNVDTCRHFLQALCPLRFNHTQKSRNWEYVASLFPVAAESLDRALKEGSKPAVAMDFAPQSRLGLPKPGKKARAAIEVADRVLSAFAYEAGFHLVGVDGRDEEKTLLLTFVPSLSVTRTYSIASTYDSAQVIANGLVEAIEKSGRTIALSEDTGKPISTIDGKHELIVTFPVHATDYDQIAMAEEVEFIAKAIFGKVEK